MNNYKSVIGLEIHVALKTASKMFCGCKNDPFGAKQPNIYTCPVCLGLPGALPVPNKKAIDWTILIGRALNCTINNVSKFDRKHYFYPDLPKGYQISQYDEPIATNGFVEFPISNFQFPNKSQIQNSKNKTFRVQRVHLEEDTAKLIHEDGDTLVDFNRSGVPLVEIVTEPDFDNSDDVKRFLEEIQVIIRYLDVSDADMEKGSMRLEPNISVGKLPITNDQLPNYKVEVKNINSFRFVKQAIEYEVERQIEILQDGNMPEQETRGFDSGKGVTYSQRSKEEAHDYRYFPEPDILPLNFREDYLDKIKVPELPQEKIDKYLKLGLRYEDAFILTRNKQMINFFEAVIFNDSVQRFKKDKNIVNLEDHVAKVIINKKLSTELQVNSFINKAIEMLQPKETDEKLLTTTINRLIVVNKKAVEDYKSGKENAIMFLVGQVMREMKGKADAKVVISKIKNQIAKI